MRALADKAYEKALTRVVVAPFSGASGNVSMGRDVAAAWRDGLAQRLSPPAAQFTRVLGSAEIEDDAPSSWRPP